MTGHLALGRDDRLMVIVPHPDDESLAAGGLLQRARAAGAAARVVFATAGENNAWTQRLLERRVRIGRADRERFGARRRGEALAALSCLGIDAGEAAFLGFPDQGITALLTSGDEEALHRLAAQIDLFRPTLLVAPAAPDLHPDHSALAVLTRLALSRTAPRRSAPERARLLGYLVHTRVAPPEGPALLELAPTAEERERKRSAILCYVTQLSVHRRKFLAFADRPERFYLDDVGLDFESGRDPAGALHPVRLASIEAGALRLEIVLRARPGAFGRPALLLRADRALGGGGTLSLDLDWRAGRAAIRRDGAAAAGEARLRGGRRGGTVEMPLAALAPADRLFVKVERPFGFFDEAGWIEVPAPGAAGASRAPETSGSGVVCVVPCYNVGSLCGPVVRGAAALADRVIAVDDGSTDDTGQVLRAAAAGDGRIRLISFAANRGKGAALLEAFRSALSDPLFDVLVTIDGDGQHRPADIPRLVAACREGADLVIGERALFSCMPLRSRIGNTLTSAFLSRLYPRAPIDTQSGFRAIDRRFLEEIGRRVEGRRYEMEIQVLLLALSQGRRIATVPIPTIYLDRNRASHFRPLADSLRIAAAIFRGSRRVTGIDQAAEPDLSRRRADRDLRRHGGGDR